MRGKFWVLCAGSILRVRLSSFNIDCCSFLGWFLTHRVREYMGWGWWMTFSLLRMLSSSSCLSWRSKLLRGDNVIVRFRVRTVNYQNTA